MKGNQEQYRLLFEMNPHPTWVFDAETLLFLAVNRAAIRHYGYSREEFLCMKATDIRPPEDIPRFLADRASKREAHHNAGLWRHVKKDGSVIEVEIFTADVVFDNRAAALVVATDVTARRASEARLRAYVEASSEGIVVTGSGGRIEFVNGKALEMFGYEREELLGKPIEVLVPERYRSAHQAQRGVFSGRAHVRPMGGGLALVARRKDGSEFPAEIGLGGVPDAGGTLQIAFINDVTVRLRAEQALRESEQRFRNLVETTSDWVWEVNEDAVYTYVSPRVRDILGYEPAEVIGRTPFEFMTDAEARRVRAAFNVLAEARRPVKALENVMLHKSGAEVVMETSGTPFFDGGGAFRGYRGIDRDITSRKRSEQELHASQERLMRAQRIARMGTWERNIATGELLWSEEVYRIFQVDPAVFRPTLDNFAAMVHPDDRAAVREAVELALRTGRPYIVDHRIVVSGGERHVHEHAEIIRDEKGKPAFLLGTVQDITEYKRLEEQLRQAQRMEAVGRLAGGVAHDFNNLLTIISGYSELLIAQMDPDSPVRHDLLEITTAAARAASLTRQLLAFSRRQVLQLKILNLNAVVSDLDKMLRRLIGEDVQLVTRLAIDLGLVKADPTQIEQVIMNLAVNARDAMPGGGRLLIETQNVDLDEQYAAEHTGIQPGPYVMLAVSDTGTGIDKDVLPHIFEPFYTTKPRDKGTGLGLSTVYGIVKQSGGSIYAYSEPGLGATFKIYMPRTGDGSLVKEAPGSAAAPRGSETILVVEDEEGVRMLLRTILSAHGYSVIEASRGAEALRRIAEGSIELLVTDVVMPEMSGRELAGQARALRPGIKVLYISGYTDEAIVQHGILDTGDAFLQKPFTHEALVRKVREVLDAGAGSLRHAG